MSTPVVGNVMALSCTFAQDGVATDPAGTITFEFKDPNGVVTSGTYNPVAGAVTVTKDATGVYHANILCTLPGTYYGNASSGSGTGQAAAETSWMIAASAFS